MKIVQPTVTYNLHEKQINQTVSHFFFLSQENNEIHLLYTIKAYTNPSKPTSHFHHQKKKKKSSESRMRKAWEGNLPTIIINTKYFIKFIIWI